MVIQASCVYLLIVSGEESIKLDRKKKNPLEVTYWRADKVKRDHFMKDPSWLSPKDVAFHFFCFLT